MFNKDISCYIILVHNLGPNSSKSIFKNCGMISIYSTSYVLFHNILGPNFPVSAILMTCYLRNDKDSILQGFVLFHNSDPETRTKFTSVGYFNALRLAA